ncbi:uncharacterized protein BP5553_10406 [Venustampulla echinocandica]|uniref:Uncharacterized protein n=1 Tax=Venustampulla echinocandica TaxID=2656787 RepID=A0A370T984_9HELO|nr:uncharacterized protein BP5553_10406 [Venustampulla echinocandica]RDL30128.1 hypothetical protein BP5553_10406 [Venustampulla echinocandica]
MGSDKVPRPAYVVDVDEDSGRAIRGSRRTASTKDKEKPKVSHRDRDKAKDTDRDTRSDKPKRRTKGDTDRDRERTDRPSDRPVTGRVERERNLEVITTERELKPLERRKSSASSTHSPQKQTRPPSAHKNRSFPRISDPSSRRDEPSHFGVPPSPTARAPIVSQPTVQAMPQPIPVRPRAITTQTFPSRPLSYHAAYNATGGYGGPPLSASAWANYQPQPMITQGYQSPGYSRYAATPAPPSSDYFGSQAMSAPDRPMSARPLASRFDPPSRTQSGFGNRDAVPYEPITYESYHDDGYASASEGTIRKRDSIRVPSRTIAKRLSKSREDYNAMPPPPRPILRRPVTEYAAESIDPYREGRTLIRDDSRPRQPSSHRNSVTYDLGHEREPSRSRRPDSNRNSASYDHIVDDPERVRIETANHGRRRQSYYGQSASGSSGYEDKIRQAANYQEDVAGPSVPLTAEVLKRQQRRQTGSSRSTKSSNSRDESDYRKSATTRTTRSGSGADDENVTIKVTGTARVMVGGAQIDCPDGGEIEIKKRQPKSLRNGSEMSGSEYGGQGQIDDRRSRVDRPSGRSRLSSQHSYTRSTQYFGDNYF